MSKADKFTTTSEHAEILTDLVRVSAASESESRTDRVFDDGSAITYTSRQGAETVVQVRAAEPHELEQIEAQDGTEVQ